MIEACAYVAVNCSFYSTLPQLEVFEAALPEGLNRGGDLHERAAAFGSVVFATATDLSVNAELDLTTKAILDRVINSLHLGRMVEEEALDLFAFVSSVRIGVLSVVDNGLALQATLYGGEQLITYWSMTD